MKDLMQKVKSFITFDFPLQATHISTNFAETHQKLQSEVHEWSTTATRQKMISTYRFTHVTAHFTFIPNYALALNRYFSHLIPNA